MQSIASKSDAASRAHGRFTAATPTPVHCLTIVSCAFVRASPSIEPALWRSSASVHVASSACVPFPFATSLMIVVRHEARVAVSSVTNPRASFAIVAWHAMASFVNRGGASAGAKASPRATGAPPTAMRVSPFVGSPSLSISWLFPASITEIECSPRLRT